jgi:hypothetical protein
MTAWGRVVLGWQEVGGQGEWVSEGVRKEAPEVGRKPFIWEFRPIPHWSPQYDADNPDKIGWDWRGEQRCKQELVRAATRSLHAQCIRVVSPATASRLPFVLGCKEPGAG